MKTVEEIAREWLRDREIIMSLPMMSIVHHELVKSLAALLAEQRTLGAIGVLDRIEAEFPMLTYPMSVLVKELRASLAERKDEG